MIFSILFQVHSNTTEVEMYFQCVYLEMVICLRNITSNFSHCSVRTVCQCKGSFTPIMIIMKITITITMLTSTSLLFL